MATPGFTAEYGLYRSTAYYQTLGSAGGHMQDLGRTSRSPQVSLALDQPPRCICVARNQRGGCIGEICFTHCPAGTVDCGGVCVDTQTDRNHCGACGNSCGPGTCQDGYCTGPCVSTNNPMLSCSPTGPDPKCCIFACNPMNCTGTYSQCWPADEDCNS